MPFPLRARLVYEMFTYFHNWETNLLVRRDGTSANKLLRADARTYGDAPKPWYVSQKYNGARRNITSRYVVSTRRSWNAGSSHLGRKYMYTGSVYFSILNQPFKYTPNENIALICEKIWSPVSVYWDPSCITRVRRNSSSLDPDRARSVVPFWGRQRTDGDGKSRKAVERSHHSHTGGNEWTEEICVENIHPSPRIESL